ncbi:MAG TPA: hypothetical protein VH590_12430 [Ktedonobacterales bacterium]|jgi:hypothetical protein
MASFLSRYERGEHEQVWAELLALDAQIREEPLYSDALAVAHETMRRVRYNIELLIPRLIELGYRFGYGWVTEQQGYDAGLVASVARLETKRPSMPWSPPSPDVQEQLAYLEQLIGGPLPLSLQAWYEVVGQADFVGELPARWGFTPETTAWAQALKAFLEEHPFPMPSFRDPEEYELEQAGEEEIEPPWAAQERVYNKHIHLLEPLYVLPLEEVVAEVHQQLAHRHYYPRLFMPIAPDHAFKYWRAGGGRYPIFVPNAAIDGKLHLEWHDTTFVGYLRICCRWAGLPELAYFAEERGKEEFHTLTEGLLPL